MIDPTQLPPEVRQQLRAKTLGLLLDLDVEAMVDEANGELVVDFAELADALGLSGAEACKSLQEAGLEDGLQSVPAGSVKSVQ